MVITNFDDDDDVMHGSYHQSFIFVSSWSYSFLLYLSLSPEHQPLHLLHFAFLDCLMDIAFRDFGQQW